MKFLSKKNMDARKMNRSPKKMRNKTGNAGRGAVAIFSPVKDGRFGSRKATGSREGDLVVVRSWQLLGGPLGTGVSRSGKLGITWALPGRYHGPYLDVTWELPGCLPWGLPGRPPGRYLGCPLGLTWPLGCYLVEPGGLDSPPTSPA